MMLNTNFQKSRPSSFRQEDFFTFPYISLCKTFDPGAGPFLAPGVLFEQNLEEVH